MLRNRIDGFSTQKTVFFLLFLLCFWKISFSLQKEEDFWKTKQKKRKWLDGFSTQKRAIFGRIFNSTACIYIHIQRKGEIIGNPNHHCFSKKVSQYTSHWYCNAPPICIAVLLFGGCGHRDVPQSREKFYVHPPPYLARRHFQCGGGGGVYILRPHVAGILYAIPPFLHAPLPLEGSFQGWGVGVYKTRPWNTHGACLNWWADLSQKCHFLSSFIVQNTQHL